MSHVKKFGENNNYLNLVDIVDSYMDGYPDLIFKIHFVEKIGGTKTMLYPFIAVDDSNMVSLEVKHSSNLHNWWGSREPTANVPRFKWDSNSKKAMDEFTSGFFDEVDNRFYTDIPQRAKGHPLVSRICEMTNYRLFFAYSRIYSVVMIFKFFGRR